MSNTEISIRPTEEVLVHRSGGKDSFEDNALPLDVIVANSLVGVNIGEVGKQSKVHLTIYPIRNADGSFRPRDESAEPAFHKDAYYLLRFTPPAMTPDRFYQFDIEGRLLN
jgi:hypothetical protein